MEFSQNKENSQYFNLIIFIFITGIDKINEEGNEEQIAISEKEILTKIAHGKNNTRISKEMEISIQSVNVFVNHILRKLKVENRKKAVIKAIQNNLIDIYDY